MPKLILTPELKQQIAEILAPLQNPEAWKALELPFAPSPAAVIRMEGEPGTGKTALANYIARKLKQPPLHLDFAGVASTQFGETEGKIKALFAAAHETQTITVIVEECDALFWSRDKITEDTTYMLGIQNTLLVEIDRLKAREIPTCLIFTTNYPQLLDKALESRFTDIVRLEPPKGLAAQKMWMAKLPRPMITDYAGITFEQVAELAELGATPRQMENAIIKISRSALLRKATPTFADFKL